MLSTVGSVKRWREGAAVVELVTHFVCYDLCVFFVLGDPVSLSLQALSNSITSCFSLRLPTITKCLRLDAWLLFMTQVRSSIFDILLVCGKERFLFQKPVELTTGDFNQYDSDLPLRAFTQLLKLFMREARILKQVELNILFKRSAVPNSIQFDFNIWPWPHTDLSSTGLCLIGESQETVVCLTSSAHASWCELMAFSFIYYFHCLN